MIVKFTLSFFVSIHLFFNLDSSDQQTAFPGAEGDRMVSASGLNPHNASDKNTVGSDVYTMHERYLK